MSVFEHVLDRYERTRNEEFGLEEYLELCRADTTAYATAA